MNDQRSRRRVLAGRGLVTALFLLASAATVPARAEMPSATPGWPSRHLTRMRFSFTMGPVPTGTFRSTVYLNQTADDGTFVMNYAVDTKLAFFLRPAFDYSIHDYFFVGVSAQYLWNLKWFALDDPARTLDVLLRLGLHSPVANRVHVYGYLAPGYSTIYLAGTDTRPSGPVLGVSMGAMYVFSDQVFASGEVGYQLGFQDVTVNDLHFDAGLSLLMVGLGLGVNL